MLSLFNYRGGITQMKKRKYKKIIQRYVKAYNNFDVDKMLVDMADNVKFENIADGLVTLSIEGKEALKEQMENAKKVFSKRTQTISQYTYNKDYAAIKVNYSAIAAVDLPNGVKAGDPIELSGKSIFMFRDNKIIELKDIAG